MNEVERGVTFDERADQLKVIIPVQVNWLLFATYTVSILIWLAMFGLVLTYLIRGLSSSALLTILLILWILVWLWFGRFLWNRWQYHAARREILFIDEDQIIVRRPVSILGLTTSYDWRHVTPFYFNDKHHCPAFDYAFHHVYFGDSLTEEHARELIQSLNERYFPDAGDDLD